MKLKKILMFSLIPTLALPTFGGLQLVSCSPENKVHKCDGSDWIGVRAGKFYETDYSVDIKNRTITYNCGLGIHTKNLVIPNFVDYHGYHLKVLLGPNCFYKNNGIVGSVELNDFIDVIPDYCFYQSFSLNTLIFHVQPLSFGAYSLYETELTRLYLKDKNGNITENPFVGTRFIGDGAFSSTLLSGKIIFGSDIEKIGRFAFEDCININEINLLSSELITTIEDRTFRHCQMMQTITLPQTIKKFGNYAFQDCELLKSINLISSNMSLDLGDFALAGCISLIGFNRPVQINSFGKYCFANDNKLKYTIFNSDEYVGDVSDGAFSGCSQLTIIKFNDNIKNVGNYAFANCSNLSILDFSSCSPSFLSTVSWSGNHIFNFCNKTGTIYIRSGQVFSSDWVSFLQRNGITISSSQDRQDGWTIQQVSDIPSQVFLPEKRELEIKIDGEGNGRGVLPGFRLNDDYIAQPSLDAMHISWADTSIYSDPPPFILSCKMIDWDPINKSFCVEMNMKKGYVCSERIVLFFFYRMLHIPSEVPEYHEAFVLNVHY